MPSRVRLRVLKLFISYDDKPATHPTPPRAVLFSLSGWSAVTFMR